MGGDFEIWIFSENQKIDAGSDDKLWIQFVPPNLPLQCQHSIQNCDDFGSYIESRVSGQLTLKS